MLKQMTSCILKVLIRQVRSIIRSSIKNLTQHQTMKPRMPNSIREKVALRIKVSAMLLKQNKQVNSPMDQVLTT